MIYLFLFLLCGLIGWVLDTGYRSIIARRYAPGTYLPCFAVSYGIAGVMIVVLFELTSPWYIQIAAGTIAAIVIEFISGVLCVAVLKRRLWDYRGHFLNLCGHIDLIHSFHWFWLVTVMNMIYQLLK